MHVYIYISFEDTKGTGLGACVYISFEDTKGTGLGACVYIYII